MMAEPKRLAAGGLEAIDKRLARWMVGRRGRRRPDVYDDVVSLRDHITALEAELNDAAEDIARIQGERNGRMNQILALDKELAAAKQIAGKGTVNGCAEAWSITGERKV